MLDLKTGENYHAACYRLQTERDEARARVAELEAALQKIYDLDHADPEAIKRAIWIAANAIQPKR